MSTTAQSPSKSVAPKPLGLGYSFFPSPEQKTDKLTPKLWPGVSSESESELASLLRLDNEKHHIFLNDQGFHNHLTHHLFAAYAMGCSPEVLSAAYKLHADYQRPAFQSPGEITERNWTEYLGNKDYYNAYMHFYGSQINAHGPEKTLEKYVFSKEANLTAEGKQGPQMLNRFMSGLLHPMIHTGHWAEFHVPGMLAEGLAMASTTNGNSTNLFPPGFFDYDTQQSGSVQSMLDQATTTIRRLSRNNPRSSSPSTYTGGAHSLDILHRMLQDPDLAAGKTCEHDSETRFGDTMNSAGDKIREYAKMWQVDSDREVPEKLEEVAWLATLVYGLGGFRKGKPFRSDFFLLHLVTSSIFISSLITHLSFPSQSALLRAQVSVILGWWVSRGRPSIPIEDYYSREFDPSSLIPKALQVHPDKSAIGVGKSSGGTTTNLPSNMWLAIIESSINHPEEHLLKNQRSLAHFDHLYGKTPQGYFEGKTELEGAEMLDGTLFWRVALHTQKALGWVREGEPQGSFDRAGLGWDHLWE
ncbi:hypothetical protein M407DRAFT_24468 [Tulasnella calospora MUT 4182]|uniref:Oxidoreductase AflY n=1 Tax=Tulasnella calospora MUT 4182 TaxID=1051891 RepID=A0A0C3LXP7_9AGAM|nr:hypothetical protein M407DRAFT_24468 [Tulasnella calospora MUT 4182]